MISNWFNSLSNRRDRNSRDSVMIVEQLTEPFDVFRPTEISEPFIFNSPHSGRCYPEAFVAASRLDVESLRRSEDSFVEDLIAPVAELGVPMMHAHFPRAFLDVNREPYELDPALIAGNLPVYANTQSVRVVGGLGTIARVVAEAEEIYAEPIPIEDALSRIELYYKPYHEALAGLTTEAVAKFGLAVLVDCHSMPSTSLYESHSERPDFVLGDRFSTSCHPEITRFAAAHLKARGYNVAFNRPYAGGFITEHYGRPARRQHALQLEINRALYMNETRYTRTTDFDTIQADILSLAEAMIAFVPGIFDAPRAAAE